MNNALLYDGFLKIEKIRSNVKGKDVDRERLIMKDSVAGIVRNESGKICLVKQFRPVVGESFYEIPAGICDKPGLSNEDILIEEINEECEIDTKDILSVNSLFDYFMAVGFSDAKLYIYDVCVKGFDTGIKYVKDDDVDLIEWFELSEIGDLIENGLVKDNKTILVYFYLLGLKDK